MLFLSIFFSYLMQILKTVSGVFYSISALQIYIGLSSID